MCRERIGKLIAEETAALRELVELLEREHTHLAANDVAALASAVSEHRRSLARIVRADDERLALCRQLGHSPDARGLEGLIRWCDPGGALAAEWARCASVAAQCRALNDRNGALVGARLKHVQARLAALVRERGETVTYGRRGAYSVSRLGRAVKVEA